MIPQPSRPNVWDENYKLPVHNLILNEDFASDSYYKSNIIPFHAPSAREVLTHLRLLRAFAKLKKQVISSLATDMAKEAKWSCYVANAFRRFIVFISAVRSATPSTPYTKRNPPSLNIIPLHDKIQEVMENMLPPLDVLMIWHSLLLNPKAAFDEFARNNFLHFLTHPYPLNLIEGSIDSEHNFVPNEKYVTKFYDLTNDYGILLTYELSVFDETFEVPICCSQCRNVLATVHFPEFCRANFKAEVENRCWHYRWTNLTHNNLRKLQMEADVWSDRVLPNVFRVRSPLMNAKHKAGDVFDLNSQIKGLVQCKISQSVRDHYRTMNTTVSHFSSIGRSPFKAIVLFREYAMMNLVHLTLPRNDVVPICEDLVGCVVRQERFIKKMEDLNWLGSPNLSEIIQGAQVRYTRFWVLLRMSSTMVVPTLDIDLVWHTHQLSFHHYHEFCELNNRLFVDHNDKVDNSKLDNSFEKTANLYRQLFREEYSQCLCWYCYSVRLGLNTKGKFLKNLFKEKINIDLDPSCDHVSLHNGVYFPSKRAKKEFEKLKSKYNLEKRNRQVPVEDPRLSGNTTTFYGVYIVPPSAPVESCSLMYPDTLCGSCDMPMCLSLDSGRASSSCGAGASISNCGSNSGTLDSYCGGSSSCGGGGSSCGSSGGSSCGSSCGGGGGGGGCGSS